MKPLSLYFHLPFCTKKCPYCHFYVVPDRPFYQSLLKEALFLELKEREDLLKTRMIPTVYFGGGTPSLFLEIESLLQAIPKDPDAEVTIEANPETLTKDKLFTFLSAGINRLSIGVQSLNETSLKSIERTHTAKKAIQAIQDAYEVGFRNISIDLMIDLPQQTEESLELTFLKLKDLPIQHISLYNLTIEPHTAFYKRKTKTPQGEESFRLLQTTIQKLEELNFKRYEISAFAKPGYSSKHNLGYWTGREFLGFGPSAFSYLNGSRFKNISNLNRYAKALKEKKSPVDFTETLKPDKKIRELLAIGLRVTKGVNLMDFSLSLGIEKSIQALQNQGLLVQNGPILQLTDRGRLFYDTVAEELI